MIKVDSGEEGFNSLPKEKLIKWSKLKAITYYKINVIQKLEFVLERVEKIVGKGENAGDQHFLLFLQCFRKDSFSSLFKSG